MRIKIELQQGKAPVGQVATAELHFEDGEALAGLKLIGFGVWERRGPASDGQFRDHYNVTFPARAYAVNGERRSFALLRPTDYTSGALTPASEALRAAIIEAYRAERAADERRTDGALSQAERANRGSVEPDGFQWAPDGEVRK